MSPGTGVVGCCAVVPTLITLYGTYNFELVIDPAAIFAVVTVPSSTCIIELFNEL
jgi:hypothetical protein